MLGLVLLGLTKCLIYMYVFFQKNYALVKLALNCNSCNDILLQDHLNIPGDSVTL